MGCVTVFGLVMLATGVGLVQTAKGAGPGVREVKADKYIIRLDLSGQEPGIEIQEDLGFGREQGRVDAPVIPTIEKLQGGFVSASMLAVKCKQCRELAGGQLMAIKHRNPCGPPSSDGMRLQNEKGFRMT